MQVQVLKAVDLIVHLHVAHIVVGVGTVKVAVDESHGVGRSQVYLGQRPGGIAKRGSLSPLPVVVEIVKAGIARVNGLRGVEAHGCADGVGVGVAVVRIHELTVDVERQVVVEQRGAEVDAGGGTLEVGGLQDTVLIGEACADAVRHVLQAARHRNIMVGRDGRVVDLLLPVGIGSTEEVLAGRSHILPANGLAGIELLHEGAVLVAVKHVDVLGNGGHRHVAVVAHLGRRALAALLRGDDDDTVGAAATIDGGGRGILQDGEALDVVRVDHGEGVGQTLHTLVVHGQTVDDDKRVVAGIE